MTDDMFTSTFPGLFKAPKRPVQKTGPKKTLPATRGWKKTGVKTVTLRVPRPPKSRPFRQRSPKGV